MSRAVRLGIFIVATLAAVASAIFLICSRQLMFTRSYHIYAEFQNVAGLEDGADVRVAGIKEGTVAQVYLPHSADEKARVEIKLNNATHDIIRKDSVAKIDTEGLVGDQYVEVSMGSLKLRGFEDKTDLTRYAIASVPAGQVARRFDIPAGKLFDKPDSARLKKGKLLDEAGKYLRSNPFALAVVAGASDMKGDTDQDRQLDEARTYVAREYLVQHFKIDDTRLKTTGLGKSAEAPDGGEVSVLVYGGRTISARR